MTKLPIAVLDACVLVPMPLADTLLRLAESPGLYEARWTEQILAEVARTLIVRFGKTPEKALYREAAMREFFPRALVRDYEPLVARMRNDPKDRHVLAAAIACRADHLVTLNLKHFRVTPESAGSLSVLGPSAFLGQLLLSDRTAVEDRLVDQAAAIGICVDDLLSRLAGLAPEFVSTLRIR